MLPSLFISHGAPNRVLHTSPANLFLQELGSSQPTPKAIVIVSAHWQHAGVAITATGQHNTIHDFAGFEHALYQQQYPAQQPAWLTDELSQALRPFASHISADIEISERGLDHGAWSVLSLMYPNADIPVAALSLPTTQDLNVYLTLGQALQPLREKNILIIASGSATHNLGLLNRNGDTPIWAEEFVYWLHQAVTNKDYTALTQLYNSAPHAAIAHPTLEHYSPLLVAAGAAYGNTGKPIHNSYELGSLNNSSFSFD